MSVDFDYSAPAELFFNSQKRQPRLGYRRFRTAAEAITFAIDGIERGSFASVTLEVDEQRYDRDGVRRLHAAADFPRLIDVAAA